MPRGNRQHRAAVALVQSRSSLTALCNEPRASGPGLLQLAVDREDNLIDLDRIRTLNLTGFGPRL